MKQSWLVFSIFMLALLLKAQAFVISDALFSLGKEAPFLSKEDQSLYSQANINKTILFLPLDERFTTRFIFLNLATLTPFQVLTPDMQYISSWKIPANLTYIDQWIEHNLPQTDIIVFSAEMYLYGGLIQSRSSNDSTTTILERLDKLVQYKTRYPNIKIYISSVVMRIPSYNSNFEEPDYWGTYGLDLYDYSFYQDRYDELHNPQDLILAQKYEHLVPTNIVNEFLWRRSRNHNVSVEMLNFQQNSSVFEQLYITLDDNAQYGFNIRESEELRALVTQYNLSDTVHIYPGADEVGLTMLAKVSVDAVGAGPVRFLIVYRNASTQDLIPNYEGQPMNLTILQQMEGAGGISVNSTNPDDYDVVLLVNNYDTEPQLEAPDQPSPSSRNFDEFDTFVPYIQAVGKNNKTVIGFADNRFSNGGDQLLYQWICKISPPTTSSMASLGFITYAGWNTDGNKLGTVISNSIVLALFKNTTRNEWFQMYRFLEDINYQSDIRQTLSNYVSETGTDSVSDLAVDLDFYEQFVFKLLNWRLVNLVEEYDLPYKMENLYFPWNRTFEIGMFIQ